MYYASLGFLATAILVIINFDILKKPHFGQTVRAHEPYRAFLFSVLNYYVTDINKNTSIIEKMFSHDGEDFTKIFAYNKKKNEIIYIGTSFNKMQYYS